MSDIKIGSRDCHSALSTYTITYTLLSNKVSKSLGFNLAS